MWSEFKKEFKQFSILYVLAVASILFGLALAFAGCPRNVSHSSGSVSSDSDNVLSNPDF